jgi:hypothetical protein
MGTLGLALPTYAWSILPWEGVPCEPLDAVGEIEVGEEMIERGDEGVWA